MRKFIGTTALSLICLTGIGQVTYYKGEWTIANKTDLFTCLLRIETSNDTMITGEFIWTYIAIDSADAVMMDAYKDKKSKTGIEYTEGTYNPVTRDFFLETVRLTDPHELLGKTKYSIKLSADKKVLYGTTTDPEEGNPGLYYAVRMKTSAGLKEFTGQKNKVE